MKRLFHLILLLFAASAFASEEEPKTVAEIEHYSTLLDFEGMPSSVVHGCVNVITGAYFETVDDLATAGANPITLTRYFTSKERKKGNLSDLWDYSMTSEIKVSKNEVSCFAQISDRGMEIPFKGYAELELDKEVMEKGIANICSPYVSGKMHLKNKSIVGNMGCFYLKTPGGEELKFSGSNMASHSDSYERYELKKIYWPNGTYFKYDRGIKAFNRKRKETGSLRIDKKKEFKVISQDGREVFYKFKKMESRNRKNGKHHRSCLESVKTDLGETKYHYKFVSKYDPEQLIRRELANNRYLDIDYHKGRVCALYAPAGIDAKPVQIYRFEYHGRWPSDADVFDAYGNKTRYHWAYDQRLRWVENTLDGIPYRRERIFWNGEKGIDQTLIKSRVFTDAQGNHLFAKRYWYDSRGNILKEIVAGDLSGTCSVPLEITKKGSIVSNGCERYAKAYTYSNNNNILTEEDGFKTIAYTYTSNGSIVRMKTVADKKGIRERVYYEYGTNGEVVLEITDDGKSGNIEDLSGVSERRIKRVVSTQNYPAGLPKEVSELYLDLTTRQEVLIRRTVNTYTQYGKLAKEEVYDSAGCFAYAKEWIYDQAGRVLEEIDASGKITSYQYDLNGNCIFKQTPNLDYHTLYSYDYSNRLIKEEEAHLDGNRFVKTYGYDLKGNKIKETDIYGNKTLFVYDSLGRVIKRILPPVPGKDGKLQRTEELFEYNELNHPVKKQDAAGHVTTMKCNAYGKPSLITHPDGSFESIHYYPDGSMKEYVDGQGTRTHYQYDYQKRKTAEVKYSLNGKKLSERRWVYSAFHLVKEIHPDGLPSVFEYDGAGRLIAERRGCKETLYIYDTLGRPVEKKELFENKKYRITVLAYDFFDQVIEEKIVDQDGTLYLKKQYAYDENGNRTHETLFTDAGPSTTITRYNSQQLPTKKIAPDGATTFYHYRYDYLNEWKQCVPYEEVIDPLGNKTTIIKNTHDGIAIQERQNIYGEAVQRTRNYFDPLGHLIRRVEDVIISKKVKETRTTAFEYDSKGREIAVIEAYGEPEQKITRRAYNCLNEIAALIKPDGVVLDYAYDALGRLSVLTSSDGTIHHRFAYDKNNQILEAEDCIHSTVTKRAYDSIGRMKYEILDHGSAITYIYDKMDRLKTLVLPDRSRIQYGYDAGYLREVKRQGKVHRYEYDLFGKVKKSRLMNLAELHYDYDCCLRPIGIRAGKWKMEHAYDPCGNITDAVQTDGLEKAEFHYDYDAMQQLISEKGVEEHDYGFDSLGNRVNRDEEAYAVNVLNQLESRGGVQYQYDLNGNLISQTKEGKTFHYRYDALDRLIEAAAGNEKTVYRYDPMHRRTSKIRHRSQGKSEERYIYQGDKEIGALNEEGELFQLRVMGIGYKGDIGAAVLLEIGKSAYVPIHDYRGNIVLLQDGGGKTKETVRYTAYGEERVFDSANRSAESINPWRFSSKRKDAETGWSYFGRRYYDAETARWTTPDPMWFADGSNLYCYVLNRPTQFIDPQGLFHELLLAAWERSTGQLDFQQIFQTEHPEYDFTDFQKYSKCADFRSCRYKPKNMEYESVHVGFINGIWNKTACAIENYEHCRKLAENCSSSAVYNATYGNADLAEACINYSGVSTRPSTLLVKEWESYFKNCPDGIYIQICHSQGTAHVSNALKNIPREMAKKIHVIAVAPLKYVDEELCGSVLHLVSKKDLIPKIDRAGMKKNKHTTLVLKRNSKAFSSMDHEFNSPTYEKYIQDRVIFVKYNWGRRKNIYKNIYL